MPPLPQGVGVSISLGQPVFLIVLVRVGFTGQGVGVRGEGSGPRPASLPSRPSACARSPDALRFRIIPVAKAVACLAAPPHPYHALVPLP